MWDWKCTPPSSIFLKGASEKTWKPPESVRKFLFHPEKPWSHPGRADYPRAGPQVEVVGVGEDESEADLLEHFLGEGLHRGVRPDRHEHRCGDGPVGQGEGPSPRAARGIGSGALEYSFHRLAPFHQVRALLNMINPIMKKNPTGAAAPIIGLM
jgi:hypothetical protein